jgi:hypothetical protein
MRASDYPLPSYAFSCWYARGRLFLARPGRGTVYFEDSPDGLNELRMALLGASEAAAPLGFGRLEPGAARSNLPAEAAPRARFTVRGKPKLAEGDLWGEDGPG